MPQEKITSLLNETNELIKKERYDQAEVLLIAAIKESETKTPQLYARLSLVYLKKKDIEKNFALLHEALGIWSKHLLFTERLAQTFMMNEEYKKAVETITSIPKENHTKGMINILINAYIALNDRERVIREQKRVDTLMPSMLAVKIVMYLLQNNDPDTLHKLVLEFAPKVTDKESFFDILQNHLFRKTNELWIESATEDSLLLYAYTLQYPEHFIPKANYILTLCENFNKTEAYQKTIDILEGHSFDGEYNSKREWVLMIAKIFIKKEIHDLDNSFKPDETLLDHSVFHYRFGHSKCLVWFTGVDIGNTARVFTRIKPLLQQFKISLFIVVDQTKMFSLLGFGNFIPDRELSISKLHQLIKEKSYKDIATSAASGSGLSALLYGLNMDANGILTFNGVTQLPEDTPDADPQALAAKHRIFKGYSLPSIDSIDLVEKHQNTMINLVYSEGFPFDKANAEYLKNFKNVILIPETHNGHDLSNYYQDTEKQQNHFKDFFEQLGWI